VGLVRKAHELKRGGASATALGSGHTAKAEQSFDIFGNLEPGQKRRVLENVSEVVGLTSLAAGNGNMSA
jgi:hypothetical protein